MSITVQTNYPTSFTRNFVCLFSFLFALSFRLLALFASFLPNLFLTEIRVKRILLHRYRFIVGVKIFVLLSITRLVSLAKPEEFFLLLCLEYQCLHISTSLCPRWKFLASKWILGGSSHISYLMLLADPFWVFRLFLGHWLSSFTLRCYIICAFSISASGILKGIFDLSFVLSLLWRLILSNLWRLLWVLLIFALFLPIGSRLHD